MKPSSEPLPSSALFDVTRAVVAVYFLTLAGSFIFIGGIPLAPLFKALSWEGAADFVYAMYSPLCHQIPERSFSLLGFPLAVCGRCLGIYAGFPAGMALYPIIRGFRSLALPSVRVLLVLTFPVAADGLAGLFGLWTTPTSLRFVTGFIWGGLLPFYFVPGVASALQERRSRRVRGRTPRLEIRPGKSIE